MKQLIFLLILLFALFFPLDDLDAKTARSTKARADFMKLIPCPSTGKTKGSCPGYVIDHIKPLKKGGADSPANMQWQTIQEAKDKDKWE